VFDRFYLCIQKNEAVVEGKGEGIDEGKPKGKVVEGNGEGS